VVVGQDAVLFAKNSDREANEAQMMEWHPARDHPAGAKLRCTWIEIPQVEHAHAVLLSRPFWMWGAEMGANEHGVAVGNEAVFTNQPYAHTGLTGMDLLLLALERATTARRAVEVIIELLERHGQGGGCGHENRSFTYHNSFLAADPCSAVVLETAGKKWATQEVHGARAISNGLTIPDFADRYSDLVKTRVSRCAARRAITESLAAKAKGAGDLFAVLRRHANEDAPPRYHWVNGAMDGPCMHAGGLLAASQTTASWAAELRASGSLHWVTGTAAPCTGIFKPIRVDEPVDIGPPPIDRFDTSSLWWRHEALHRRVMRNPTALLPLYAAERDEIERRWLAAPPESTAAFVQADDWLRRWTARVASAEAKDTRPFFVRRYWTRRNRKAGFFG
jgi:dipeptidase